MFRGPPRLPPFPYTTPFRSEREISGGPEEGAAAAQTEPSGDGAASQEEVTAAPAGGVGGTAGRVISSEDPRVMAGGPVEGAVIDRKSTRLNSSHANISYAVF